MINALSAFDALSQESRLRIFRLLVQRGPEGLQAGKIGKTLGIPHNTLSFHLSHMSNASLVKANRKGRSIIYSADFKFIRSLICYMVKNCCNTEFASMREDTRKGTSIIEFINCCPSEKEKP